jgi:hypothetical protein
LNERSFILIKTAAFADSKKGYFLKVVSKPCHRAVLFFFLDEKEPKNQGCMQILRFCCPFRRVRAQTRPSFVGAQIWALSAASKRAKSGFE